MRKAIERLLGLAPHGAVGSCPNPAPATDAWREHAIGFCLALMTVAALLGFVFFRLSSAETAMDAVLDGNGRLLRQVIEQGADPDRLAAFSHPALHDGQVRRVTPFYAAISLRREGLAMLLLELGAASEEIWNRRALCSAAALGFEEMIELLLARGFGPDQDCDEDARTPLRLARETGEEGSAALLLAAGAEEYLTLGETVIAGQGSLFRELLRAGADPDRPVAFRHGEIADGKEQMVTPLFAAAALQRDEMIAELLAAGASLPGNRLALCAAVAAGNGSTVALLLASGLDANTEPKCDSDHLSPRALARLKGHGGIGELLESAGGLEHY